MRLAFLLAGLLLLAAPSHASSVLSLGDGDTISVTEGTARVKVRLACIDAPETSQTPYGMEARRALQGLLPIGSKVTLEPRQQIAMAGALLKFLRAAPTSTSLWSGLAVPSSTGSTSAGVFARPTPTWRTKLA